LGPFAQPNKKKIKINTRSVSLCSKNLDKQLMFKLAAAHCCKNEVADCAAAVKSCSGNCKSSKMRVVAAVQTEKIS